jgi:1-phosphofructokinase
VTSEVPEKSAAGVCVFAPAPVLTLTVEHDANGENEFHLHAGGQGFWVARMIQGLGHPVTLCAPLGGESGSVLSLLIERECVELASVPMPGSNGAYLHDRRSGERRPIAETAQPTLGRHEHDELYSVTMASALRHGVCVLAGARPESVLPVETYERLVRDLTAASVAVVADLSGSQLRSAVSAGIPTLKVSDEEIVEAGYARDASVELLLVAIDALQDEGAADVIVSRSDAPTLARVGSRLLEVQAPHLQVVDHRGAGDSMTAGLAVAKARQLDVEDTLRLVVAAGAVNVTRHGLATGEAATIDELARRVEISERSTVT